MDLRFTHVVIAVLCGVGLVLGVGGLTILFTTTARPTSGAERQSQPPLEDGKIRCAGVERGPVHFVMLDNSRRAVCLSRLPSWRFAAVITAFEANMAGREACLKIKGCKWSAEDVVSSMKMLIEVWLDKQIEDEGARRP